MHLRVNRIMYPVHNLGPGCRVALWLQGCKILCPGCINPELHNRRIGRRVEISSFVISLSQINAHINGITITGGEPFDQYEELIAFCTFFKKKTKKHIYVYSGYSLDELLAKFPDHLFLRSIDMLNAGPYIKELNKAEYFRGSSNQKLYSFEPENRDGSEKVKIIQLPFIEVSAKWSMGLGGNSEIFLSGIPGKNDMNTISEKMKSSGIKSIFNHV